MKLKNEALEKLYGTIVNSTITISPFSESPIDKAFAECDRELTNIQNRNDILEKSNGTLLDANLDLCSKNRDLKKELDAAKSSVKYFEASRDTWRSRSKHEEEEKIEQVKRADSLAEQVNKVLGEKFQLQKEIEQLKKDLDALLSRTHCAEDEAEHLKKDKQWLEHSRLEWAKRAVERGKELNEAKEKNQDLKNRLDKANADRTEQQKNLDYYMDIYKKIQDDYNDLHKKYSECEATVDKQAEQIKHLKGRLNSISNACGRTQDDIYGHGYEQGQADLWEALQNVKDSQPNEFDVECECLGDVIDMDLEDFLDAYKNWQEEKETDRMRDYLERFCMGKLCISCPLHTDGFKCGHGSWFSDMSAEDIKRYYEKAREEEEQQKDIDRMRNWLADFCYGRVCKGCPLEGTEYKCGCGYSFYGTNPIPDKDIKRYYEKARGCRRYTLNDGKLFATPNMEETRKAISKACEGFRKAVRDADAKITENLRKGCTFEAEVKIDKDLFEKLCGVKSEEEEHKFEYGDAVRLPWRDYDYMYIGPEDGNETIIRMFDTKNHAIVTTHIGNVRYNGSKIILTSEEDLKKIWKDKK